MGKRLDAQAFLQNRYTNCQPVRERYSTSLVTRDTQNSELSLDTH